MKKLFSLLLCIVLIFSLSLPSLAVSTSNENLPSDTQKEAIITSLHHVENIKDDFGLNNISFSELSVGNKIHFYHYTNNGFEEARIAFPLFYEGKLIALARELNNDHYQITTSLANEIAGMNCSAISVIYDFDSCYLYDGLSFTLLKKNQTEVSSRSTLPNSSSRATLNTSEIKLSDTTVSIPLAYDIQPMPLSTSTYYTHDVEYVSQFPPNPSYICWAATIACIKNSVDSSSSLTAIDVAKKQYGSTDYNKTLLHSTAATLMKNSYSLSYTYKTSVPSTKVVCKNIENGKPIFGIFSYVISSRSTSKGYHDVTIYGIDTSENYVEVMDPEFGSTISYKSGSVYTYVSDWSDVDLTWVEAICSTWSSW